jgi:hypothetical protein
MTEPSDREPDRAHRIRASRGAGTQNRVTSSRASWSRTDAARAAASRCRRSSLKSFYADTRVIASTPPACARAVNVALARCPAGSLSRTM